MNVGALHLLRPELLWLLLPSALLIIGLGFARSRAGDWSKVIAPELLPLLLGESGGRRGPNPLPALLLLWVMAVAAAAGPSFTRIPQPVHQKQDALVVILDLSYSMYAEDLSPSRISRARQKILDLLTQRREGQTGLIAYAGDSHIVSPLTDDNPTIANLLPALRPDIMPVPGSDPAAAVNQALGLLLSAGVQGGQVLLMTDGVTVDDADAIQDLMDDSNARLDVLGVGTVEGAPIPLPRGGFLKDRTGDIVVPALQRGPLQQVADSGRGRYGDIQLGDNDLDWITSEALLNDLDLEQGTRRLDREADTWEDQGYYLMLLLLPGVLLCFRRGWLGLLLPIMLFAPVEEANAFEWQDLWYTPDQQGQRALQEGDAARAAKLFDNSQWAAAANYEAGDYPAAEEGFAGEDSADGWYNRGNALAREGKLEDAISAYRESLVRTPDQGDAKENIALLEELLKQQEQEQNQNQEEDQDQDQDQQQQDQNQDQDQNQQQDQDSESSEQQDSPQDQPENEGQEQEDQTPEDEEQPAEPEEEQSDQQPEEEQHEEQQQEESEEQDAQSQSQPPAAAAEPTSEELEDQQAMEQWLRRVPDDPAGLLREKFRYESRQREAQGQRKDDEAYW